MLAFSLLQARKTNSCCVILWWSAGLRTLHKSCSLSCDNAPGRAEDNENSRVGVGRHHWEELLFSCIKNANNSSLERFILVTFIRPRGWKRSGILESRCCGRHSRYNIVAPFLLEHESPCGPTLKSALVQFKVRLTEVIFCSISCLDTKGIAKYICLRIIRRISQILRDGRHFLTTSVFISTSCCSRCDMSEVFVYLLSLTCVPQTKVNEMVCTLETHCTCDMPSHTGSNQSPVCKRLFACFPFSHQDTCWELSVLCSLLYVFVGCDFHQTHSRSLQWFSPIPCWFCQM